MQKIPSLAIGTVLLLLGGAGTALAAGTYYPYEHYDDYYKTHSVEPPPPPKPSLPPTQPVPEVKPPPAQQPLVVREAPEFLYPPGLGFGVAVGVPFDMFYVSKAFYLYKDGVWYRSTSYKGPWIQVPITRIPPELRKTSLAKIHKLRNEEFAKFWKNKSGYRGKYYRPTDELPPPLKSEKKEEKGAK